MLLRLFNLLGVGRRDITAAHLNAILYLTRNTLWGRESRLDLPHGVTARYCREWLILETRPQLLTEVQLLPGCPVTWGDYRLTLLDQPEGEGLALRPWRQGEPMGLTVGPAEPGDRLILPETHGGGRSVKRLCLDPHGAGPAAGHLRRGVSRRRVAAGGGRSVFRIGGRALPVYSDRRSGKGERP